MSEGSVIDRVRAEVDQLPPEEIRKQYEELEARRQKGLVKARKRRENRTPEQIAKDAERYKEYAAKPETKERAKAYREREDVKEKTKEREKERREKNKLLVAKAKELIAAGVIPPVEVEAGTVETATEAPTSEAPAGEQPAQ